MGTTKIVISIDEDLLARLDRLVSEERFANRSHAVQEAVRDKLGRLKRRRLACECTKLDSQFEQRLADGGRLNSVY